MSLLGWLSVIISRRESLEISVARVEWSLAGKDRDRVRDEWRERLMINKEIRTLDAAADRGASTIRAPDY